MEVPELPLLRVEGLKKYFPVEKGFLSKLLSMRQSFVHAVDDISFEINEGETVSLVGETGSGKTTTGRLVLRAIEPTAGKIFFEGKDILSMGKEEIRGLRRDMQIIFQDPFASLNPRLKVGSIIGEPLEVHKVSRGRETRERVEELLDKVGLTPPEEYIDRYPHEFSGGQRQRIVVARALTLNPKFIVADEPVSALDMSVRAGVLNLMQDLKKELGLTYLFIAHDLSVVKYVSDHVLVLYLGKIMERAPYEELFESPLHPYTQALLAAIPVPDPKYDRKRIRLKGEMPSPIDPPPGCRFSNRCPRAKPECFKFEPEAYETSPGHKVACHLFNYL
ncbi:MAG: ABC transporter ATP-binding protein [Candidatus Bathyarchaeia archaeon]